MKDFNNPRFCFKIKQSIHGFQLERSKIICLAFTAVFLLAGGLGLPILRAENQAVDRSDISSHIEQVRSLVSKNQFEQAIEGLVAA
jgi:hypothetical protein